MHESSENGATRMQCLKTPETLSETQSTHMTHRDVRKAHIRSSIWETGGSALGMLLLLVTGASCNLTKDPGLPAGTPDPAFYNTVAGALGLRVGAITELSAAIQFYIGETGVLTDELEDKKTGTTFTSGNGVAAVEDPLDERILPEGVRAPNTTLDATESYAYLQNVRGAANVALGALAAYDTAAAQVATQRVMRGELFAFQGYADILLAELFCSGVPLSTLDYRKDFTYQPSLTSAQVYADALSKLDSALVLAAGGDSVRYMALVLKGRAQLELGKYAAAADDVSTVPDNFQYRLTIPKPGNDLGLVGTSSNQAYTMSDSEGENGLPFLSSGDPRMVVQVTCSAGDERCPVQSLTLPWKYMEQPSEGATYTTFVVADWIEARLIQAEAALQAQNTASWLHELNLLRANATVPGQIGTLDSLSDPGSDTARVSLLFQERAYWLFMTGHRQGDLRRLIRQYGRQYPSSDFRTQDRVYPTGEYLAPGTGLYGSDITAPIPTTEYANPYYHGCKDRSA